jgi:hyaluronan synthase
MVTRDSPLRADDDITALRGGPGGRHRRDFKDSAFRYLIVVPALTVLVGGIVIYKATDLRYLLDDPIWVGYSTLVATYLLSRFVLAMGYRPPTVRDPRPTHLPSVTVVIPAMNEEAVIERTIRACAAVDYPEDRYEIIAIDDGSTDRTGDIMLAMAEEFPTVEAIVFPQNLGKREGMATGVIRGNGEVIVFVDSDSRPKPNAIRKIVQYFAYDEVGAVSGLADVDNKDVNVLTKMQAVRYYVAFNVVKAAEARYRAVTCCSGAFSAYRRQAVEEVLDEWLAQSFLGSRSTYGDDRSLTNHVLREGWDILYAPDAHARTMVPEDLGVFLRQQLRWKKSWIRESLSAARFMWKGHPVNSLAFYGSVLLTLMSPHVILRSLFVRPLSLWAFPYFYLLGILAMSLLYGLYYRMHRPDPLWKYGIAFALFYTCVLVWQLPYAILNLSDTRWGTRAC